jgi:hypothetical protein
LQRDPDEEDPLDETIKGVQADTSETDRSLLYEARFASIGGKASGRQTPGNRWLDATSFAVDPGRTGFDHQRVPPLLMRIAEPMTSYDILGSIEDGV